MDPLKVTLNRAKETENAIRYEESAGDQPPVIGTLYIRKWAIRRIGEPDKITITVEVPAGSTQSPSTA
jgi:hypothetical protein